MNLGIGGFFIFRLLLFVSRNISINSELSCFTGVFPIKMYRLNP